MAIPSPSVPHARRILGIETSGRSGSVAVVCEEQALAEIELSATGRRHARTLIPEIRNVCQAAGLSLHALDGLAVSIGPGSFTGLRVGVVCAKTLAYALEKPIVGVDTFMSVAEQCSESCEKLLVIDDALRGDVYCGAYAVQDDRRACITSPRLMSIEALKELAQDGWSIVGPGTLKLKSELRGFPLIDVETWQHVPQARTIAKLGCRRMAVGLVDDMWSLEPHYIRRSAAEEKAEQSDQSASSP